MKVTLYLGISLNIGHFETNNFPSIYHKKLKVQINCGYY